MSLKRRIQCAACVLLLMLIPSKLGGSEAENRRVQSGLRFFRTLLASDTGLRAKTVDKEQLLVLFIHAGNERRTRDLAKRFLQEGNPPGTILGLQLVAETTDDATFAKYAKRRPAAVFVAEPLDDRALLPIIRYGISQRVIIYSPFEGHVERGVLGGLSVEAQVRPFVNLGTMEASHISLGSWFLRAAKVYR